MKTPRAVVTDAELSMGAIEANMVDARNALKEASDVIIGLRSDYMVYRARQADYIEFLMREVSEDRTSYDLYTKYNTTPRDECDHDGGRLVDEFCDSCGSWTDEAQERKACLRCVGCRVNEPCLEPL